MIHKRFPGAVRPAFSASILKEIFNFGFPALLAGLLVPPAYWWANTLLARHAGFEEVGLFGVAFALAQLIMLVPSSLSIPAVSFMSETRAAAGQARFSKLVTANLRLMWALALPPCMGCALASGLIVQVCFGQGYVRATGLMFWTSFTALWIVIGTQMGLAITSLGRMWEGFGVNTIWLVMFVGLASWWTTKYGAYGLAAAFFVSYLIFGLVLWQYSKRWLKIRYEGVRGIALLTLGAVGVSYLASSHFGVLISSLMAVFFSLALVWAEWKLVLDNNERNFIKKVFAWLPSQT
jgi:O-antigen/teichoic acid export membrane protein